MALLQYTVRKMNTAMRSSESAAKTRMHLQLSQVLLARGLSSWGQHTLSGAGLSAWILLRSSAKSMISSQMFWRTVVWCRWAMSTGEVGVADTELMRTCQTGSGNLTGLSWAPTLGQSEEAWKVGAACLVEPRSGRAG